MENEATDTTNPHSLTHCSLPHSTGNRRQKKQLVFAIGDNTCILELVESEAEATEEPTAQDDETPEWLPDLPTYTLSDECDDLKELLFSPSNGTLWLSLSDNGEEWLALDTVEDDPYPPQLDARGRFFGCRIPVEGDQNCYVLTEFEGETVLVVIPLFIGDAYTPAEPEPTATSEIMAVTPQTWDNNGGQNNDSGQGSNPPAQPTPVPQPTDEPECPPWGCDEED